MDTQGVLIGKGSHKAMAEISEDSGEMEERFLAIPAHHRNPQMVWDECQAPAAQTADNLRVFGIG